MLAGALIVLSIATLSLALALVTRPRSVPELALTALLVAYAWLVVAALGLSAVSAFDAPTLAATSCLAALLAVGLGARRRSLSPELEAREAAGVVREALRDARVAALAIVVAAGLGYSLALTLATPPAEVDAVAYHLTRAAFWVQEGAVEAVPGSQDPRIDESPPGAEIAVAVTMLASGCVRFAGIVQWLSVLVAVLAIGGIARRLGVAPAPATFAGLLVAPLPVIALQSPTGLNDVVVGALAAVAVYFLLGDRRVDPALAGIAVGSLVVTKLTALAALPVLLAVALVATPSLLRLARIACVTAGALVGASWLVIRPSASGAGAIGGVDTDYLGSPDVIEAVGRLSRLLTELLELPGAIGADAFLFLLPALILVLAAAVRQARAGNGATLLVAALLVATTPLLVPVASTAARIHRKAWFELGRSDIAFLDLDRGVDDVFATTVWYGAVGLAITALGAAVAMTKRRWRREPARVLLGLAPLAWVAVVAVAVGYSPYEGRFVMPGILLGAAATAPLLHRPAVAWWAVAVSATTLLLVWTHSDERPAGIRLLADTTAESVWTRDDANALPQRGLPEAIRFVRAARIPEDARLALWPAPFPDPPTEDPVGLLAFPFFGPNLERELVYARSLGEAQTAQGAWALLPRARADGCRPGWRRETSPDAPYQAFRHDPSATCAG